MQCSWQGITKALLSCSEATVSHPRALAQLTIVWGRQQHQGGQTRTANSEQRQQSHPGRKVQFSSCCLNVQTKLHIYPSQLSSRGRRVRAHLPHLHPTRITRYNLQLSSAGASLVVLFSISFKSSKGSQDCLCCTLLMTNPFTKNWHTN